MGDRFARVRSSLLRTVSKCGPRGVFSLKKQLQQYDRDESGALDRDGAPPRSPRPASASPSSPALASPSVSTLTSPSAR